MNKKTMIFICLCAVMLITVGCTVQSRLAEDYGTSYQLQKYNQILDAEAEKNLEPMTGISAQAAKNIEDKYQQGFEKPQQATTSYQISIGGGK